MHHINYFLYTSNCLTLVMNTDLLNHKASSKLYVEEVYEFDRTRRDLLSCYILVWLWPQILGSPAFNPSIVQPCLLTILIGKRMEFCKSSVASEGMLLFLLCFLCVNISSGTGEAPLLPCRGSCNIKSPKFTEPQIY